MSDFNSSSNIHSKNKKKSNWLIFINADSLKEHWRFKVTTFNLLAIIGCLFFFIATLTSVLLIFTPLKYLIPGYPSQESDYRLQQTSVLIDSIKYEIALRDNYIQAVQAVIDGQLKDEQFDSLIVNASYKNIDLSASKNDSLFRLEVEQDDQFNFLPKQSQASEDLPMARIHFFKPLDGIVTKPFDVRQGQFGIDIVAAQNEVVKVVLDGMILYSGWTSSDAYVTVVQHRANLVTVYKNSANILKKQGDFVKAGDAIAILGSNLDEGSQIFLHFELWRNGIAINPEDYLVF